jgi:hypothetical protein
VIRKIDENDFGLLEERAIIRAATGGDRAKIRATRK